MSGTPSESSAHSRNIHVRSIKPHALQALISPNNKHLEANLVSHIRKTHGSFKSSLQESTNMRPIIDLTPDTSKPGFRSKCQTLKIQATRLYKQSPPKTHHAHHPFECLNGLSTKLDAFWQLPEKAPKGRQQGRPQPLRSIPRPARSRQFISFGRKPPSSPKSRSCVAAVLQGPDVAVPVAD